MGWSETLPRTLAGASRAAMLCVFLAALLAAIAGPSSDAAAQARIACGSFYRVAPGDTLHRIATRAYGKGDYQTIFEANRDILPDISRIAVGDELLIPCLDGARPRIRAVALAHASGAGAAGGTDSASAIISDNGGIGFLPGANFAPFVDPAFPGGGVAPQLGPVAPSDAPPLPALAPLA